MVTKFGKSAAATLNFPSELDPPFFKAVMELVPCAFRFKERHAKRDASLLRKRVQQTSDITVVKVLVDFKNRCCTRASVSGLK